MSIEYMSEYNRWLSNDCVTGELSRELSEIKSDAAAIKDRFGARLEFGTAGLRGILGAGTNRMNIFVVRQATAALCELLKQKESASRGVVIAYDSRNMSADFAREAACVLAAHGIHVYLFSTLHSVPQLSYSVRYYKCAAGIVITASHNPKEYNGYKVYGEDGGQIEPSACKKIQDHIEKIDVLAAAGICIDEAVARGMIEFVGDEADEAYYKDTMTLLQHSELTAKQLSLGIVYSPLHGSGKVPVTTILERCGFSNVHVVREQSEPDGNFPTVSTPNPESEDAFLLAKKLADEKDCDLLIATDPDSDRLGVCVRNEHGDFTRLSGNQVGCLLLNYILTSLHEKGIQTTDAVVAKSIVSTELADKLCESFSVSIRNTLTGFRYISKIADECAKSTDKTFIFGFEESCGYLSGSFARDKDAICSSMLICEAAAYYRTMNKTLLCVLNEIYAKFGYYVEITKSFDARGADGMQKVQELMHSLRNERSQSIAGIKIHCFEDYLADTAISSDGTVQKLSLSAADMLRYVFQCGSVVIRPSGTEPKLKLYALVHDACENNAKVTADTIIACFAEKIEKILG